LSQREEDGILHYRLQGPFMQHLFKGQRETHFLAFIQEPSQQVQVPVRGHLSILQHIQECMDKGFWIGKTLGPGLALGVCHVISLFQTTAQC